MNELKEFVSIAGDVGIFPVIIWMAWKSGMIKIPFIQSVQQEKDESRLSETPSRADAEFQGYVRAKLEAVDDKMDAFGDRLSRHLDEEERQRKQDMDRISDELSAIKGDIKSLQRR